MSEALNQLLDSDGSDYRNAKRFRRSPLLESVRPNPFDLLSRAPGAPQSRFDGRESVNTQDWRFMTHAEPGQSFYGGLRDKQMETADEMREAKRQMPFPPLGGRNYRGHMIHSTNYGQGVPEISQQYQEAINTPQNQLLEEVMRSLAMSDGTEEVALNELDATPMGMGADYYPPNPPKSPMP